jgi:hypothetical protein
MQTYEQIRTALQERETFYRKVSERYKEAFDKLEGLTPTPTNGNGTQPKAEYQTVAERVTAILANGLPWEGKMIAKRAKVSYPHALGVLIKLMRDGAVKRVSRGMYRKA